MQSTVLFFAPFTAPDQSTLAMRTSAAADPTVAVHAYITVDDV